MTRTLTAAVAATMDEKTFANHVAAFSRDLMSACPGFFAYHTFDSRRSQEGMPDWFMVTPLGVWFLELKGKRKSGVGQLSPAQQRVLGMLKVNPMLTPDRSLVVYPWDWMDVSARIAAECGVTL